MIPSLAAALKRLQDPLANLVRLHLPSLLLGQSFDFEKW